MKAARPRSSGSVGRNGTGRKARILNSATRGLCLVALALGLAACATPLPGGLPREEARQLEIGPGANQLARLPDVASGVPCSRSDYVVLSSLTPAEAQRVLDVTCRLIAGPESMAYAWRKFQALAGEDGPRFRRDFEDLQQMELVGLRKVGVAYQKNEITVLMATFCPRHPSPRALPISYDCPETPRTLLEFALDEAWEVMEFNVEPASSFHYDNFDRAVAPDSFNVDGYADNGQCASDLPIALDSLAASEAGPILKLICDLIERPARPVRLEDVDPRARTELTELQMVALGMLTFDVSPDAQVLVAALFCPRLPVPQAADKRNPCPASYRMLELTFKSSTELELLSIAYRRATPD